MLLLAKGVDLRVAPAAREWLGTKGFDRRLGARPLARIIQDEVKRPLADEVLFGKLENGGSVEIRLSDDGMKLEFEVEARAKRSAVPVTSSTGADD